MSNPYFDEDEKYDMKLGFAIAFIIIAMVLLMTALPSCSFVKDVQKSTLDSNATKKLDSGAVRKNTNTNIDENEYYRNILMLFANKRDTNITNNHIYPPDGSNTSPQNPAVIYIQEGGKQRKENTTTNYDSTWQARFDSLAVRLEKKDKTSESEFFSPTVILALFGGLALLVIIVLIWAQYNLNKNSKTVTAILSKLTNQ